MAEKKVNKAAAIRDYAASHPNDGPTATAKALSVQGIKVSPQQVSITLANARKKKGTTPGRRGPKPKSGVVRATGAFTVEELIRAKKLADAFGGVHKAKAALDALARIFH